MADRIIVVELPEVRIYPWSCLLDLGLRLNYRCLVVTQTKPKQRAFWFSSFAGETGMDFDHSLWNGVCFSLYPGIGYFIYKEPFFPHQYCIGKYVTSLRTACEPEIWIIHSVLGRWKTVLPWRNLASMYFNRKGTGRLGVGQLYFRTGDGIEYSWKGIYNILWIQGLRI